MLNRRLSSGIITTLETRLDDCQLANETGRLFIPNGMLEQILDQDTVHDVLSELSASLGELPRHAEDYARIICNQNQPFRKILALLLLTGIPEAIISFVDLDINDSALPMPDPKLVLSGGSSSPYHPREETDGWRKLQSLEHSWITRSCLRNIYVRQWCLSAPRFDRIDTIPHYTFTHDRILPFLQYDLGSSGPSETSHPPDPSVRYGSFSQVRMVKIHPNHYDFSDYEISNPDHLFAIKKLRTRDYDDFNQEIKVFKRHWRSHLRIVPLLATYEVREIISNDPISSYCLIFPWAKGDLRSFWKMNEELVQNCEIIPWISLQCLEITRALSNIHGDLHHPETSEDSFGSHGDIKPSNILWFPNTSGINAGDLGKLVLSDFGLADFHSATSRSNSGTASLPRSMTYRAPEFDATKKIPQAIDIWSLGCTFLEFITWFLQGNEAVLDEFPEYRSEIDLYGINSHTFLTVQHYEGHRSVTLKAQIVTWIQRLRNNKLCSMYLKDLLHIIQRDMLVVSPLNGRTANDISRELEALYSRCVDDIKYYKTPDLSNNAHTDTSRVASSVPIKKRSETDDRKGRRLGSFFRDAFGLR
ncbi:kinase-like domain-containing protein [Hypomontagnella monticulosa]|nr:kinase-like domain-containing protein [Hypomontagnella monticulosa]